MMIKKLVAVCLFLALASVLLPSDNATGTKCSMEEYRMFKAGEYVDGYIPQARQDAANELYLQIADQSKDHIMCYYYSGAEYKALLRNINACQEIYFYYSPFRYAEVSTGTDTGYITINTASARKYRGYTQNLCLNIPKLVKKAGVTKKTDELAAARKIHDFIKKTYKYDYEEKSNNAFSMVNRKKGVCTAYAELYMYMCNYCGLRCEIVHSDRFSHAWNRVKCSGTWYYCDVTWDDSEGTSMYRLKTKRAFYKNGKHKGAETYEYVVVDLE